MRLFKRVTEAMLNEKELADTLCDDRVESDEQYESEIERLDDRCTELEDILSGLIDTVLEAKSIRDARSAAELAIGEWGELDRGYELLDEEEDE